MLVPLPSMDFALVILGGKNSADRSLLVDLMYWVSQNPPPAHLFLISGDRDFAGILHRLRMNNYNILLACPESTPCVLCSAASIMWHWSSLLKGENLAGKHFNQPPDGPYGSWYGHYRWPLEDPFAVAEQPACARAEDLPDSGTDCKDRQIPKIVVKQIRRILYSNPKGIPITDLRAELFKSNVIIDKDFYGYKKFSRFLLAMPQILKLQRESDGQYLVRAAPQKAPEQGEPIPGMITGPMQNREEHSVSIPILNGEKSYCSQNVEENPTHSLSSETAVKDAGKQQFLLVEDQKSSQQTQVTASTEPKLTSLVSPSEKLGKEKVQEQAGEVHQPPALVQVLEKAESTETGLHDYSPVSELGFFNKLWRKWLGHTDSGLGEKVDSESVTFSPQMLKSEENGAKSEVQHVESMSPTPFSPSSTEAMVESNKLRTSEADEEKSKRSSGFLSQLLKFWKGSTSDNISEELKGKTEKNELYYGIFAKEFFWEELKAFIDTPGGAAVVVQSSTRQALCFLFY